MAKYSVIYSATCYVLLLLLNVANGTGNTHVEGNRNSFAEERARRDVNGQGMQHISDSTNSLLVDESVNNQKDIALHNGPLKDLNIIKRTPAGFMGMRGKKEYNVPNLMSDNDALNWDDDYVDDTTDSSHDFNGNRFKKAPAAFYGVRGKKFSYNKLGDAVTTGYSTELARLSEFMNNLEEERAREKLLQDLLTRVSSSTAYENEINKRAPIGFTGVRGKRPLNSFYDDILGDEPEVSAYEKRGPVNAFVGLRGKKDVSHQNFKRSPGDPYSSRSKQQRFVDFGNKFVAVRGKKNSPASALSAYFGNDLAGASDFMYPNGHYLLNMLPSSFLYDANGKRTPSGFMGMRGKRAVTFSSPDLDTPADADADEVAATGTFASNKNVA